MKILCYGDSNTYGYDPCSFIGSRYPAEHRWVDRLAQDILSDGSSLLSGLMSRLPGMATGLLGNLSEWLFGLITGILSGYMISLRLPKLKIWVKTRLPDRWQKVPHLPVQR